MNVAETMAAFDISDEDWDATPKAVQLALTKAAAAPELLEAHMDDDLAKEIAVRLIGDTLVAFLEWRDRQCAAIVKATGAA